MRIPDITVVPDETIEQNNGAKWPVYFSDSDEHEFTIVTGAGSNLLSQDKKDQTLSKLVERYNAVRLGGTAAMGGAGVGVEYSVGEFLGAGREAAVFSMGHFAVRERLGLGNFYSLLSELQKMSALNTVIEEGLPRWLNLPAHYFLNSELSSQRVYIVMDRVNGGLTAEDIMSYPEVPESRKLMDKERFGLIVHRALGEHIAEAQSQVPYLYNRAHKILFSALQAKGNEPSRYLTDWHPRNILVEPLVTPVAGSDYGLYVIDQYSK